MNLGQSSSRKPFVFLFAVALLAFNLVHAATLSETVSEVRVRIVADLTPKVPGLSVAVGENGEIIWSESFGYADLEAKKPVTPQTLFRIGSVSKSLTAAGLMLLVEKGKVDLDADIHCYVPDYPDKGHPITTRQLGGHLAGIRHYEGNEFYLNRHYTNVRDSLRIFENDPLLFVPGEKYAYSSYGYNLLSMVMEAAAGRDFLSYMNSAVFTPLNLTNTIPDDVLRPIPQRTRFYKAREGGGFELEPDVDNSYKWASGGFLSTPEDLVRFGSALLRPGFLTQASLDALFTSQKTRDGHATGYGIGWSIPSDKKGYHVWMHTGGSVGGTSLLLIQPESRIVLAMTANCSDAPLNKANPAATIKAFSALFPAK